MGGTMRCGQRKTIFKDQKIMYKLYGSKAEVSERHRHRYEVNPEHVKEISSKGLKFVGEDVDGERMEIIELEGHPFFVGLQVKKQDYMISSPSICLYLGSSGVYFAPTKAIATLFGTDFGINWQAGKIFEK